MTANDTKKRPLILVTNDDGIDAPGIVALASVMDEVGEIVVVAPVDEQSAVGHAITVHQPVRVRPWSFAVPSGMAEAYAVTGTPADCVKLALSTILKRKPDLVVSGINHGENNAVNVLYSGTVSAATEASILGIDAIAFSLCTKEAYPLDVSAGYARTIAERVLKVGLPHWILLNVNVPALSDIRGVAVTRLAHSRWEEGFVERRDPLDRPYYWLTGHFVNLDHGDSTDVEAVRNGFVSITPLQHDLTAHSWLEEFRDWDWEADGSG